MPHYRGKIRVSASFPCNFIHPKAGSLQVPRPCISPMCLIAGSLFMNDSELGWSFLNESGNLTIVPPPHTKKTQIQIIHRYYQVIVKSTSACAKVLIEEHDKEMQRTCFVRPTATGFATDSTLLMREGWSWIRLFFMSTPQQTHVLARPMEPGSNHP